MTDADPIPSGWWVAFGLCAWIVAIVAAVGMLIIWRMRLLTLLLIPVLLVGCGGSWEVELENGVPKRVFYRGDDPKLRNTELAVPQGQWIEPSGDERFDGALREAAGHGRAGEWDEARLAGIDAVRRANRLQLDGSDAVSSVRANADTAEKDLE